MMFTIFCWILILLSVGWVGYQLGLLLRYRRSMRLFRLAQQRDRIVLLIAQNGADDTTKQAYQLAQSAITMAEARDYRGMVGLAETALDIVEPAATDHRGPCVECGYQPLCATAIGIIGFIRQDSWVVWMAGSILVRKHHPLRMLIPVLRVLIACLTIGDWSIRTLEEVGRRTRRVDDRLRQSHAISA